MTIGFDRAGPALRIDNKALTKDGAFGIVSLAPYSGHTAAFTRDAGAALTFTFPRAEEVRAFSFRTYNYGQGDNRFAVSFNQGPPIIIDAPKGAEGQQVLRRELSPAQMVETVRITALAVGQNSALIDHLDLETTGYPWRRMVYLALFSLVLAGLLTLAPRVLVVHSASSGRNYLFIDYMRGIGAVLVLLLHARGYTQLPDFQGATWFGAIARNGHLGVEVFYFVSAYTLTLSLLSSAGKDRPDSAPVLDFWLRRLARILPAFMFVMVMMVVMRRFAYAEVGDKMTLGVAAHHLFMTYVFNDRVLNTVIQHSAWWSISTELQFYILLPAFASGAWLSLMHTGRLPLARRIMVGLLVFVAGVALAAVTRRMLTGVHWSAYMALYHFDVFAGGIGLAVVMNGRTSVEQTPARGPARWLLTAAWVCLLLAVVAFYHSFGALAAFRPFGVEILNALGWQRAVLALGLAAVVVVADWTERHNAASPTSPLRVVGVLSFIIYLVHIPALQFVQRFLIPARFAGSDQAYAAAVPLALILCVAGALVIHRLVEVPGMNAVRNPALRPALRLGTHVYILIVAVLFFFFAR